MEIDQIKTFLAVATFGGFHRAADALRISQPAVSARIKALEESLGLRCLPALAAASPCPKPAEFSALTLRSYCAPHRSPRRLCMS